MPTCQGLSRAFEYLTPWESHDTIAYYGALLNITQKTKPGWLEILEACLRNRYAHGRKHLLDFGDLLTVNMAEIAHKSPQYSKSYID